MSLGSRFVWSVQASVIRARYCPRRMRPSRRLRPRRRVVSTSSRSRVPAKAACPGHTIFASARVARNWRANLLSSWSRRSARRGRTYHLGLDRTCARSEARAGGVKIADLTRQCTQVESRRSSQSEERHGRSDVPGAIAMSLERFVASWVS